MIPQALINDYNTLHKIVHDFELSQYNKNQLAQCVRGFRVRDSYGRKIRTVNQLQNMKAFVNNEHQYRTRVSTKQRAEVLLAGANLIFKPTDTFEYVRKSVSTLIGPDTDLFIHDISLRVGAAWGIYPKDFVYLHAGALEGAIALQKHHYPNMVINTPSVSLQSFVSAVPVLNGFTAYDIEHFLCVYHQIL